jgi:hypothetical protein
MTNTKKKATTANPVFIHQKRYTEKQKNRERSRVNVWIPDEYRDELRAIAAAMRDGSWED